MAPCYPQSGPAAYRGPHRSSWIGRAWYLRVQSANWSKNSLALARAPERQVTSCQNAHRVPRKATNLQNWQISYSAADTRFLRRPWIFDEAALRKDWCGCWPERRAWPGIPKDWRAARSDTKGDTRGEHGPSELRISVLRRTQGGYWGAWTREHKAEEHDRFAACWGLAW